MEPATAPGITFASQPEIPPPSPATAASPNSIPTPTPARKIRSDAKLEQLSPRQRERLHVWLEDENRSYHEVVHLLRAEFHLTVGKSAVALFWRRHLLPQRHEEEAEIAATIAALPATDFDTATLNQARVLAWSALARPQPQVQDAVKLLEMLHRAERLSLARQRLALEERRLALREAETDHPVRPPRLDSRKKPSPPPPNLQTSEAPPSPAPIPQTPEPISPFPPTTSPSFPGYSGLLQPPADAPNNQAPLSTDPPPKPPSAIRPSPLAQEIAASKCTLIDENLFRSSSPPVQILQFKNAAFRISCFSCISWLPLPFSGSDRAPALLATDPSRLAASPPSSPAPRPL